MSLMTQQNWDEYIQTMNEWQNDVFQQDITWRRVAVLASSDGEDDNIRYSDMLIKCLVQYNHFRAWPITQTTDSGEIDKESLMVYFNLNYLKELDLLNEFDQFKFKPDHDIFVLNGLTYKAFGESQVAQAKDKPLFLFIILKREELLTGQNKY